MADTEAEKAIHDAFGDLARIGDPRNSTTVPPVAIDRLGGVTPSGNENDRIYKAIKDMVACGELDAPVEPWKDWSLLCPAPSFSPLPRR